MRNAFHRLLAAGLVLFSGVARAEPIADFYRRKTITVLVAHTAGGDYDNRARMLARHMSKHVPGSPRFVVQNMPGAGGLRSANYLFNIAPRDGTVLAALDQQMPLAQAFAEKGVEFDAARMAYIGNTSSSPIVMVAWHTSAVKTFADLQRHELLVGGTGANSASILVPLMINALVGTRFKPISGYPGGNEVYLAMEKGEVAGRATQNWSGWKAQKPDWLTEGKIHLLVQTGRRRHPELAQVPLISEFARSDEDRRIMEIYFAPAEIARPIAAGPEVPAERISALRKAFDETLKDPEFKAETDRARMEIDAMSGTEVQAIVLQILRAPTAVINRARAFSQTK